MDGGLRPRCVGSSTPMSTALIALRCRTTPCHGAVLSAEYGAELSAETDSDRQLPDNILRRGQTTSYSCPRVSASFTTPQIYATTNPLVEEKTIPFRSGSWRTNASVWVLRCIKSGLYQTRNAWQSPACSPPGANWRANWAQLDRRSSNFQQT